jgi:hypothetical protein
MTGEAIKMQTGTCDYTVREDGIIVQTARDFARQELADAEENMRVFRQLAGGKPRLLLVDLRRSGPTGAGVREYYAKHAELLIANAMLIEGSLSEMIGNFFIRLNRPSAPTRLFTSEAAAIAWLKSEAVRVAG